MTIEKKIITAQQERAQGVETFQKNKEDVTNLLNSYKGHIAKSLPSFVSADAFISGFLIYMINNPELMQCSKLSIVACALSLSQFGLIPNEHMGTAYLSAENNVKKRVKECTFIIGYKGLILLARRSGYIKNIETAVVYAANEKDGDYFDYDLGLDKKLAHKPVDLDDPARITHFYAIAYLPDTAPTFKVITRAGVEKARDESLEGRGPGSKAEVIWNKHFDEMGMKTAIRKLFKNIPMSNDFAKAIAMDEAGDYGKQNAAAEFIDIMPEFTSDLANEVLNEAEAEKAYQDEQRKLALSAKNKQKGDQVAKATLTALEKRKAVKEANANKRAKTKDK